MNIRLACVICGHEGDGDTLPYRCPVCGGPLELPTIKSGEIRHSKSPRQSIVERYADFYPYVADTTGLSMGEGMTALAIAPQLAQKLGIAELRVKREDTNPTWSFKDRGTYIALLHALSLGMKRVGTVSTGNMAASMAAYSARAGLDANIFVATNTAEEKLKPIAVYGAKLIRVDGDYAELYARSYDMGKKKGIYFANSDVAFRVEGSKSIAYEICEQYNFDLPEFVVVPSSSGGNFRGIHKGFKEFVECGLIPKMPRLVAAQAAACAPVTEAFERGDARISRVVPQETIAHAIRNPYPPSGDRVLELLRADNGLACAVTEGELIYAQRLLAEGSGVFGQPAPGAGLAVIIKLIKQGVIRPCDRVALVASGSGLKYTGALEHHEFSFDTVTLDELDSGI